MKAPLFFVCFLTACGLDPLGALGEDSGATDGTDPVPVGISASPELVDFGAVAVGDSSTLDLVLRNNTDEGINVEDAVVSGASDIVIDSLFGFPIPIPSSGEAVVSVVFSPTLDQDYSGSLQFAVGADLFEVPVVGIGGEGGGTDGTDGGSGNPDGLNASASRLSFPDTDTNAQSVQSLTLTNSGVDDVLVTDLRFSGSGWDWAPSSGESFTLSQVIAPGGTKTLDIFFEPSEERSYSDTLTIEQNGDAPVTVSLSGRGTEPPCTICAPDLVVDTGGSDPYLISVGSVLGIPGEGTLILYNQGDLDLDIRSANLRNDSSGGTFSLSGLSSVTIPPFGSHTATVTFICPEFCLDIPNPFTGENYLTINSNDPDEPAYEIGLSAI